MGQFAVIHVSKGKGSCKGLTDHNERSDGYILPKNVDPSRSYLNIIEDYTFLGDTLDKRADTIIKQAGVTRKIQKDAVKYCPILLSGSQETMMQIVNENRLNEWIADNRKFIEEKYGKQNIISFSMHADELTPHIHVSVVPIIRDKDKKGRDRARLSGRDLFSPSQLKKLQTEYAAAMAKWGLQRGIDSQITGAKHQDTKQFYRDLPEKLEKAQKEIAQLEALVKDYSKIKAVKDVTTSLVSRLRRNNELESLKAQVDELKIQLEKVTNERDKIAKRALEISTLNGEMLVQYSQLKDENKELLKYKNSLDRKMIEAQNMGLKNALKHINSFLNRNGLSAIDYRGSSQDTSPALYWQNKPGIKQNRAM